MAQSVHVTIDYDAERENLAAGATNALMHFESIEPSAAVPDPSRDGHISVKVTVPQFTFEAVLAVLEDLRKTGVKLDGPLDIHVEKLHQIGGSDGASYMWKLPQN